MYELDFDYDGRSEGVATVDVDGREYRVEKWPDIDSENPRSFDGNGVRFYLWGSYGPMVNELDDAGKAGEFLQILIDEYGVTDMDSIERRFEMWRRFTGDRTQLFTGSAHGYSQGDWREYVALVRPFILGMYGRETPESLVRREAEIYRQWADHEISVVSVTGPHCDETCGDLYSDAIADFVAEAIDSAEATVKAEANTVGAGFITNI